MEGEKRINLGLQGGGAHGAFTWGVLDRLLEDGRLDIHALTATSAGAMNAVALAYGLHKGGRDGARQSLDAFWGAISHLADRAFPLGDVFDEVVPGWEQAQQALTYMAMEMVNLAASPYQLNPAGLNPLRDVLNDVIDFDELNECTSIKLFISATNVRTGGIRVFTNEELSVDAVLASACLPHLFQAVEIEGESYWDGGYMGNPSLWPLFYETDVEDLMVVHINPIRRDDIPKTPAAINNRINEISFNAALLKEMRAISFVHRLLDEGWLKDEYRDRLSNIRFHSIRADKVFDDLSVASKYDAGRRFLLTLKEAGRDTASAWLEAGYDDIGVRSTVDLHRDFLGHGLRQDR